MQTRTALTLKHFLHKRRMTIKEFASMVQLSRYTIHKYLNGSNVHPIAADKIEKYTMGQIRAKDLL